MLPHYNAVYFIFFRPDVQNVPAFVAVDLKRSVVTALPVVLWLPEQQARRRQQSQCLRSKCKQTAQLSMPRSLHCLQMDHMFLVEKSCSR